MNTSVGIIIIIACLIMSAFFSATETAFSSLNRIRVKSLAEKRRQAGGFGAAALRPV